MRKGEAGGGDKSAPVMCRRTAALFYSFTIQVHRRLAIDECVCVNVCAELGLSHIRLPACQYAAR